MIMKKFAFVLLMVFLLTSFLKAQESSFKLDDKVLNIGIGVGSGLYSGLYYKSSIPAISISYEKGIVDNIIDKGVIAIGGYVGYTSYKYDAGGWGWKYSNFILAGRGSFHYPFLDKLDTYAGILLGYNISASKEFGTFPGMNDSNAAGGIVWSGFVGGRYYFTDRFAAMLELGAGITYLNLGIAIKM
jgi:hypothetical protein